MGSRGSGQSHRRLALPARTGRRRHGAVPAGATGPGPIGALPGDRRNARQGAEDRLRSAAGVRGRHDEQPRTHQAAGGVLMRTATTIEASQGGRWREQVDFVVEAEKLGLDICWVAEAWGSDAPSALGYYAARTHRMLLGSAIMQVGTRTPVAVAQTAITLSNLSDGRFLLGLGASGPQVIEGLHGIPHARPLTRMRETVEVVRGAFTGEKISYSGSTYQIPLPGGEAKPMRLSAKAEHPI